jgi:carbonic anhydrase
LKIIFLKTKKMKHKMKSAALSIALIIISLASCNSGKNKTEAANTSGSPAIHEHVTINTPDEALAELKAGNQRFLDGKLINTNYKEQIEQTKSDQHPHSVILSCEDSRVPPEIIFDQGIGNIFVNRVAGNVEDVNMLGSIEYAVKAKGTKLIVVMGHKSCGAIHGAVDNVQFGNLTALLNEIKPAIKGDPANMEEMLDETSQNNVKMTVADILSKSPVISELVNAGKVKIVGAYYDITTGKVSFME